MIDPDLPAGMRKASYQDWKQVGGITAEAFAEDPVNLWIFGNARAIRPLFMIMARDIYLKRGLCHLIGDDGATMWADESTDLRFPPLSLLKLMTAQTFHGSKGAMKRGMQTGQALVENHPSDPHIYLFAIGTRKAARGKGVGKGLLAPVLAEADRIGKPVYLENSNPVNTGFYNAHGFERMKLFYPGEGAPVMEAMWREPRTS